MNGRTRTGVGEILNSLSLRACWRAEWNCQCLNFQRIQRVRPSPQRNVYYLRPIFALNVHIFAVIRTQGPLDLRNMITSQFRASVRLRVWKSEVEALHSDPGLDPVFLNVHVPSIADAAGTRRCLTTGSRAGGASPGGAPPSRRRGRPAPRGGPAPLPPGA